MRATPEILIANDKARKGWETLVSTESAKPARVRIGLAKDLSGRRLKATIRLTDPAAELPAKAVVRAVLFQREAITKVTAGENEGKTLTEYFLVLKLNDALSVKKALEKKGVVANFHLPEGVEHENLGVAVLVEDPEKMETIEAATFSLSDPRGKSPRLVIRELDENRGASVAERISGAAEEHGIELAVAVTDALPESETKPVVLGYSVAGGKAMELAAKNRKKISGLVLVASAALMDTSTVKALGKDVPVLLVFGRSDGMAPVVCGEDLMEALRTLGVKVKLVIVETGDHSTVLTEGAKTFLPWIKSL